MMMPYIACRSRADYEHPLSSKPPNPTFGYCCEICGKELAISPRGIKLMQDGAKPLCNPCANKLLAEFGGVVMLTPECIAQLEDKARKMRAAQNN